jgi:tetratricopeptide (TPR) repeat protein
MKRVLPFFLVILWSVLFQAFILFRLPSIQLVKYSLAADLLLQGKLQGERILDFSPIYLYLHVLLQKIDAPATALTWIHIGCIALSTGLLFQLLRNHFQLWIAITGTAAFLFERSLIVYTHTFEPEPLLLVLIVSSTYLVSNQTPRTALIAGLIFGLSILTRPNFLPLLLAIPLYYKMNSVGNSWRKMTLLFVLPVLFCVTAIWARNASIMGHFSPFVMNPGTAVYEGNNPNSWGMSAVYPPVLNQVSIRYTNPDYHHQLYRDFARRVAAKNLTLTEVNSYWARKARAFLFDHPERSLRLAATKIFHFFHAFQWHDLGVAYSIERALKELWPFKTPFALLSVLCIGGLWLLRKDWKKYLLFYAIFINQFLFMIAIYVSARQRVVILFLFVFFACAALEQILTRKNSRWLLVPIAILAIFLHLRTDLMSEENHLWENIRMSNAHLSESYRLRNRGEFDRAALESARSLALAPMLIDSRRPANLHFGERGFAAKAVAFSRNGNEAQLMDRGILLLESGQTKEAEHIFQQLERSNYRLKRDDYQSSELKFYLARCAVKDNQFAKAVDYLKKAIESSPGDPSSLAYLKALTDNGEYERQLLRYFDEIDASFFLGKAYMETGMAQKSVKYFQSVTRILPEFRAGFLYLAAALGESEMYDGAATQYRQAISMSPDPVFFEQSILTTFRELAHRNNTAFHHYSYGVVLRQFGHFKEALAEQKTAIAKDPGNKEIAQEINTLQKVLQAH